MMPTWWVPATRRGKEVWAAVPGPLVTELMRVGRLVPYRYQRYRGAKIYCTHADQLAVAPGAVAVQLEAGTIPDDSPLRASGRARSTRPGPTPTSDAQHEIARLQRELVEAKRRIVGLELELQRRRQQPAPAGLPDLTELIGLCHPDRHPEGRQALANRITAQLIALRAAR